jgi:hypothetical protein
MVLSIGEDYQHFETNIQTPHVPTGLYLHSFGAYTMIEVVEL